MPSPKLMLFASAVVLASLAQHGSLADESADPSKANTPLDRTRREVRMLDDIYKGGIVTITQHYVNDEEMIPAGTAFKKLFKAAEEKGWHKVRLLDATGEPYNDENVAEDDFERAALKKLVAGEAWVEQVEVREGTQHLRVATAIPVVFAKCAMCHDNYNDVEEGQAIGALSYTLPIDGPLVTSSKSLEKSKDDE